MKSLKSKNEINQAAFAPNMYDPLGMYGYIRHAVGVSIQ